MKCGKNLIDVMFTSFSVIITMEDVYNILGIILVILNILWLSYRFITTIKDKHAKGDSEGIVKEGQQFIQDLQDVRDNIKKGGDK